MAVKASASSTNRPAWASSGGKTSFKSSPAPQPHTTVDRDKTSGDERHHCVRIISSARCVSTHDACWPIRLTKTRPAPAASAARAASQAAPAMPRAPPTTATSPWWPLCDECGRGGELGQPLSQAVASPAGTPRVSNHTWPAWSRPSAVKHPGLRVSSDKVFWARTSGPPRAAPVSGFRPEGTSTASTGACCWFRVLMAWAMSPVTARVAPRPSKASMARSQRGSCAAPWLSHGCIDTPAAAAMAQAAAASGGKAAESPSSHTRTSLPLARRCRAATRPSPPLFPGPANTCTILACGAMASARRATARPAACINAPGECSAVASVSAARVAAELCSGQHNPSVVTLVVPLYRLTMTF